MCGDGKQAFRDVGVDEEQSHITRDELKSKRKPHVRETEEMQFIRDTMR
jgi:hypothetical protein